MENKEKEKIIFSPAEQKRCFLEIKSQLIKLLYLIEEEKNGEKDDDVVDATGASSTSSKETKSDVKSDVVVADGASKTGAKSTTKTNKTSTKKTTSTTKKTITRKSSK